MSARETTFQVNDRLSIPMDELTFTFVRSSGPGGQNVNKVSSQAQMTWGIDANTSLPEALRARLRVHCRGRISKVGILRITGDKYRDRERNREDCLERFRALILAVEHPPVTRKKTKIPRRMIERRLKNKQQRSSLKQSRRPPNSSD